MALEKKIKILYLITKGNWGGAQRYVYDLATSLPPEKYEVLVAAGEGSELFEKLREKNVRTMELPYLGRDIKLGKDLRTFFQIVKLFKTEKPDIIHINSSKIGFLGTLAGRITILLTKNYRLKTIFTAHNWAFNEDRPFLQKIFFKIVHFFTVIFSHVTIAVSEKTKKDMAWLPFMKKKITVIHNGISKPNYLERKEARTFIAPNIHAQFWIGTISELHSSKGLTFAIEGFEKFYGDYPQSVFIIIGDGEEKTDLQDLIARKNLMEKVVLLGKIPDAAKYIKAFDVFMLTSRNEAFPYVILEAGLSLVPVIASAVGGIPEAIKTLESGIITRPCNPKEIHAALLHLLKDEKDREKYGHNLAIAIEKKFGLEKMIKKTAAFYKIV